jgi:hypothetical protein
VGYGVIPGFVVSLVQPDPKESSDRVAWLVLRDILVLQVNAEPVEFEDLQVLREIRGRVVQVAFAACVVLPGLTAWSVIVAFGGQPACVERLACVVSPVFVV